jgi:hypothetical protein
LTTLVTIAAALASLPGSASAGASYEPNDTVFSASGPLMINQAYAAALESASDKDFFFFYVTAPGPTQTALTIENLAGGTLDSDIDVTVLDSTATPVGGVAFLRKGEFRSTTLELDTGKYFVEISQNQGSGDAYRLTTSGSSGAFGPYSAIAGRCATATARLEAAESALRRADAKLQRSLNRLRRSRYAGESARRSARALYRRARSRAGSRKRDLRAARRSLSPWCAISR